MDRRTSIHTFSSNKFVSSRTGLPKTSDGFLFDGELFIPSDDILFICEW